MTTVHITRVTDGDGTHFYAACVVCRRPRWRGDLRDTRDYAMTDAVSHKRTEKHAEALERDLRKLMVGKENSTP